MTRFIFNEVDGERVNVIAANGCKRGPGDVHIATIEEIYSQNPVIRWHQPFGMVGTRQMLKLYDQWIAEW